MPQAAESLGGPELGLETVINSLRPSRTRFRMEAPPSLCCSGLPTGLGVEPGAGQGWGRGASNENQAQAGGSRASARAEVGALQGVEAATGWTSQALQPLPCSGRERQTSVPKGDIL